MKQYYDPQKITILYSPEKTDYVINSLHYNSVANFDNLNYYPLLRWSNLLSKNLITNMIIGKFFMVLIF